jgi:hypothetical protein
MPLEETALNGNHQILVCAGHINVMGENISTIEKSTDALLGG